MKSPKEKTSVSRLSRLSDPGQGEGSRRNPLLALPWTLALAIVAVLAATALALMLSIRETGGHLVYALDDPYIHMAMARNVAEHGVWGISASHFSASSSSLLWTAALSGAFLIAGVRDVIPLVANVLLGVTLLAVVFRQLSGSAVGRNPWLMFVTLLGVGFAAPLPSLTFVGQEHILHAIVTLLFVDRAAFILSRAGGAIRDRQFLVLCALGLLLPLIRFEAIFLVGIVAVMLVATRRVAAAAVLLAAAAVPLAIHGAISTSLGWYWLPNSVILKGSRPQFTTLRDAVDAFGYISYSRLMGIPAVAFLLYAALVAFVVRATRGARDALQWKLGIFALLTLAHMQYAQPRAFWFYRYEAYLITLGIVVVAQAVGEWLGQLQDRRWGGTERVVSIGAVLLLVAFSPLSDRAVRAFARIPQATTNIYEQQYQTGLFVKRFYNDSAVALNDIGAPSYLADVETIDLVGLANMDVAKRVLKGWFTADDIEEVAATNHVRIAVVYDSWFRGRIPSAWQKAGTWTIRNNIVTGGDAISFYAVQPGEVTLLRTNLREFARDLPPTIAQQIQ